MEPHWTGFFVPRRCRPLQLILRQVLIPCPSGNGSGTRIESLPRIALFFVLALMTSAHGAGAQQPMRVIEVHAHRFAFEPASITLRRGETVRLRLISDDVPHSLLIRGLGINEAATKSHPGDIVFTAAQAGDFEGRCGRFCGSGHGRMHFTVHVTGE